MPYIGKSTDGLGVRSRFLFLADASDTSVSGADASGATLSFSDGAYVDVYLNGVLLKAGTDYNTSTANTVAGMSAMAANDEVTVIVYDVFTVGDMVSASDGGTFVGNVAMSGTLGVTGATTTAAITASGIIKTDATTDATSTTDGSLQTDGGLSVAKDAVIGDDLLMLSDSAVIKFGADSDVTLTHSADAGLLLKTTSTSDDTYPSLVMQTGETDIAVSDILGRVAFQAPDEGTGTDAIVVGADIIAFSEGNFAADNNATSLSLRTASSGAVSTVLQAKSTGDIHISSGDITFGGAGKGINLGVTSNTDSNTLDDYEEGTWTPTFYQGMSAQSYSVASGTYVKIGSQVLVQIWLYGNSSGNTSSGAGLVIGNLPFVIGSASGTHEYTRGHGVVNYSGYNAVDTEATLYGYNNQDRVSVGKNQGRDAHTAGNNGTAANSKYFIAGFTYTVAF